MVGLVWRIQSGDSNECEVMQNMNLNETRGLEDQRTRGADLDKFYPVPAGWPAEYPGYLDSFINVDILH